jgi:hypothetical protein
MNLNNTEIQAIHPMSRCRLWVNDCLAGHWQVRQFYPIFGSKVGMKIIPRDDCLASESYRGCRRVVQQVDAPVVSEQRWPQTLVWIF